MTEKKILLHKYGADGLFLYIKQDGRVEYVVAYLKKNAQVGDDVNSWYQGKYFTNLYDAVDYFKFNA